MGELFHRTREGGGWRWSAAGGFLVLALPILGALAAGPGPLPATAQAPPVAEPVLVAEGPAEVVSLELGRLTGGEYLDIFASGPLVWTSYHDEDGRLVVELPDSWPAAALASLETTTGLVAEVAVETGTGDRPLTRLRLRTRDAAEHSLNSLGDRLRVELRPVAASPVAATTLGGPGGGGWEPAAVPAAPAWPEMGTPDAPLHGPAPSGVVATRLEGVLARAGAEGTEVEVLGDGEFAYATFRLREPERFVVDLMGVVDTSPRATVPVGSGGVERVRVAQFKPHPDLVSRVVFDLHRPLVPAIVRSSDGLRVLFSAEFEAAAGTPVTLAEEMGAETPPEDDDLPPDPPVKVSYLEEPVEPMEEAPPPAAPEAMQEESSTTEVESAPLAFSEPEPAPAPPPADEVRREPATPGVGTFERRSVGGPEKVYRGDPVDFSLKDADIKDVLRTFAQLSGLNIVVQPGVSGTVTVELTNVPWDQALEQILKINGLGYELEGNIMRIAPVARLREEAQEQQRLVQAQALSIPLQTVIKRISYAEADEIAGILRGRGGASIISQRGSVIVDGRTNTLIISELPSFIDTIIAVIENLDTPEPQVMIEARIVETTKRFTRTLGIDWGLTGIADQAHGNTTGLQFPNNVTATGGVQLLTGSQNGFLNLTLGNVLNTFILDASLQAAENEGLINILSAPKVATLNNEQASIQSGLQIPIQTVANNTVSVQFINATLRLEVTPHVTAEGTILMDINVQKRNPELAFAVVGATNAPINTREARTRVIVRDGGTTVIGGIYEVTTDQGEDRVPGLSNVPVLKHLFKNKRRTDENRELLIFITPRVIKL